MSIVETYFNSKQKLMEYFEIDNDYYVYNAVNYKWNIRKNNEVSFLVLYKTNEMKEEYVVVKRNNLPHFQEKDEFSLYVAIDCIKVAFIVKNSNRLADI